jgi:rhodanese-related sulfurtransferase
MKDSPVQFPATAHKPDIQRILLEGAFVAVMGVAFAFAANAISPRGLALTRNYFPSVPPSSTAPVPGASLRPGAAAANTNTASINAVSTNAASPAELLAARLKAQGLHLVTSNQAAQLFLDPRYERGLIVFVDARDDQRYQEGHVPSAYQFDHYRAEKYLGTVLPVCQAAEQIVIYCIGGDCEDSEFAALTLSNAGVPKKKLFVFGGGMTEWATNGLPVEVGKRKSGNLRPATK